MLLMSLLMNFSVPNRDVAVNLPSHKLGSAGALALYGITKNGDGSVEILLLLMGTELGTFLKGACGSDGGIENV